MEVFLRGVPPGLSGKTLQANLNPYMNALGIQDWNCKALGQKPFAFVIFLNLSDGKKFLAQYGNQNASTSKLIVFNKFVSVVPSKKAPTAIEINHLKHEMDKRSMAVSEPAPPEKPIVFGFRQIDLGLNMFIEPEKELTFIRHSHYGAMGTVKFGRRTVIIKFRDQLQTRVEIPFSGIFAMSYDTNDITMNLVLSEPPRFYTKPDANQVLSMLDNLSLGSSRRQPGLMRWTSFPRPEVHEDHTPHCLVYSITAILPPEELDKHMRRLMDRNVLDISSHRISSLRPSRRLHFLTSFRDFNKMLQAIDSRREMSFGIMFQMQALVRNNYIHPRVGIEMLAQMKKHLDEEKRTKKPPPFSVESLKRLFQDIPYPTPGTDPDRLTCEGLMEKLAALEDAIQTDAFKAWEEYTQGSVRQSWVFKATVTPTRITLHGPDLETNNRILRKFSDYTDYFLRVQFTEENGEDMFFTSSVSNEQVLQRFRDVLGGGIPLAGRRFGFLGFSHSSLRSHSAWFSAPFVDKDRTLQTYNQIIGDLGSFAHIRSPARCAARIGQAFSETPFSIRLSDHGIQYRYIPDFKSTDGTRCFSDGVGTISREAVCEIWDALPMSKRRPTCFQIRWAGAKGMLSLDQRLSGRQFCIRNGSMEKFTALDKRDLEICDMGSRPLRLVLNQQMIKIMEDLGVRESWFMRLQKREIDMLKAVTESAHNTAAFLNIHDIGDGMSLPKFIRRLHAWGINYRGDPFLRSVVESTVHRELRLLKHKARIPVDKGVTLFGVVDETGFLEEGEVYVTYDTTYRGGRGNFDSSLKDGPVLVTRSPALHPGDIQWAIQTTPPEHHDLRALQNCIVFNRKGERDLPSMLSGGDLDGDIYNIIWDPEALPKTFASPANYFSPAERQLDQPVTAKDMAEFFVDFMKTDQLGMIATRHMIVADKMEEGTFHHDCLDLAEMHSHAVDFSKTGMPVDVSAMPNPSARFRPDFLAPAAPSKLYDRGEIDFIATDENIEDDDEGLPAYNFYKSDKILGKLYRNVNEESIWSDHVKRSIPGSEGPSIWEQLLGLVTSVISRSCLAGKINWKRQHETAWHLREKFDMHMMDLRQQYAENYTDLLKEVETFSGSIFTKKGKQTRKQRDSGIRLKERSNKHLTWLTLCLRDGGERQQLAASVTARGLGSGPSTSTDSLVEGGLVDGGGASLGGTTEDPEVRAFRAIELSLACIHVGSVRDTALSKELKRDVNYTGDGKMQSFRVVAAGTLLRELEPYATASTRDGRSRGGYVGVR